MAPAFTWWEHSSPALLFSVSLWNIWNAKTGHNNNNNKGRTGTTNDPSVTLQKRPHSAQFDVCLSRKRRSPLGQQRGQCVWVTGGMFPSSPSLWPQQDTSSEIMGLRPWLISSFMTHVWALHLQSTCCYVTGGSGEMTRHKSTTTSRTNALLSGFSVHKRLYKHHYTERLATQLVCQAL